MKRYYLLTCLLAALLVGCKDGLDMDTTTVTTYIVAVHSSTVDMQVIAENQYGDFSSATISEYGFYLSDTNNQPSESDILVKKTHSSEYYWYNTNNDLLLTITGLAANTTYYAKPFISNNLGIVTGDVISFTTSGTAKVTTKVATQISATTAQLNATVELVGENVNLAKRGFVLSTSNNPTKETANTNNWAEVGNIGDYGAQYTGLQSSTRYYFRGYVVVDGETLYGNVLNFTTLTPDDAITLSLNSVTDITNNSAKVSGSIAIGKDAVGQISECGFIASTNNNPTFDNWHSSWYYNSSNNSDFSTWSGQKNLSGTFSSLSQNTLYYYRMYYKIGTQYYYGSTIKSFSTTGSSQTVISLVDFLGTYSCHAHRQRNNDYVDWNNVIISSFIGEDNNEWIKVEGLIYGQKGYFAQGKFEESTGIIHLYGGYYDGEHTCTINAKGDALLYPVFYPMYVNGTDTSYLSNNENDVDFMGEILLIKNSDGTISFQPSNKADANGRYANVYRFDYFLVSDLSSTNLSTVFYLLDGTTLTKTSSATSAPAMIKSRKAIKRE